jgi:hypothetical protein
MRRADGIISLNGIPVWHEPFRARYNTVNHMYLTVRNGLVINVFHNFSIWKSVKLILIRYVLQELKRGALRSGLILKALQDFLQGPRLLSRSGNTIE